MFMVK